MMLGMKALKAVMASGLLALMAAGAQAATFDLIYTSNGAPPPGVNDCSGDFGTPPGCVYQSVDNYYFNGAGAGGTSAAYDTNDYGALALIAKFDNPFAASPSYTAGTIPGGSFTFQVISSILHWTFTPGSSESAIFAFSVKGGNNYNVWEIDTAPVNSGGVQTFSGWFSPQGSTTGAISHISFFGKELPPAPIPVPAAGFLLLGALGGLAVVRRRRKA